MDDFVLLTERYGLKPRGKSAPMAVLKRSVNHNNGETCHFGSGDDVNAELPSSGHTEFSIGSKFDAGNSDGFDDFLVFNELNKSPSDNFGYDAGDLFTVMPEPISSSVTTVDDLLGDFTGLGPEAQSLNQNVSDDLGKNEDGLHELIPGFGGSGQLSNSKFHQSEAVEAKKQQFGVDDFPPIFGADPFTGEYEEFPGESDKRRLARWEREQIIKNRRAKAIADMNNRDRQIQSEQEERSRISETLDAEIKLWAAGKEGNMRALLSSLHLILWPGCGWEAVSLTDLITCAAVKKVYKKANLYVHPDKVQQKGAQQKYIAEKVFNILQEAWNKFNKGELF